MKIPPAVFKEYDIRGKYPQELDERAAYALGLAFARITQAKKIVIGRDARAESEKVFWPLVSGLQAGGLSISDLGACATPELFFAVGEKKFPCGVMVTASHSPKGETGFKFCDSRGRVYGLKTGLRKLKTLADKELAKMPPGQKFSPNKGKVIFLSVAEEYKKFVSSFIKPADVADSSIIIDASSGSGGHLADVVFRALPLKFTPLNFRPADKRFQHGPNPLLPENQLAARKQVKKAKADLGVIFDADADRAIFIDERGEMVQPYFMNCLFARIFLELKKGMTVMADARLHLAIAKTVKANGGRILVQRSGYANFIKMMTTKKLLFGCENSGHLMINFALKKKQQYVYGDVIIPILLLLKHLKKNKLTLSQAIKPFAIDYKISGEINYPVQDFAKIKNSIKRSFRAAKLIEIDGLSGLAPDQEWFFNVRPSHTEPLVRVNLEAKSQASLNTLENKLLPLIK